MDTQPDHRIAAAINKLAVELSEEWENDPDTVCSVLDTFVRQCKGVLFAPLQSVNPDHDPFSCMGLLRLTLELWSTRCGFSFRFEAFKPIDDYLKDQSDGYDVEIDNPFERDSFAEALVAPLESELYRMRRWLDGEEEPFLGLRIANAEARIVTRDGYAASVAFTGAPFDLFRKMLRSRERGLTDAMAIEITGSSGNVRKLRQRISETLSPLDVKCDLNRLIDHKSPV